MEKTDLNLLKTSVTVLNNVTDLERKCEENTNPDSAKEEINYGSINTRTGIIIGIQVNLSVSLFSCSF